MTSITLIVRLMNNCHTQYRKRSFRLGRRVSKYDDKTKNKTPQNSIPTFNNAIIMIFLPIKFLSIFIPFDRMQFIPAHTIITQ